MEIKISDKYLWMAIVVCVAVGFLLALLGFILSVSAGRDIEQALSGLATLAVGIALAAIPYLLMVSVRNLLSAMSGGDDTG